MVTSGQVSVPGGGANAVFTVTGVHTYAYALDFQNALGGKNAIVPTHPLNLMLTPALGDPAPTLALTKAGYTYDNASGLSYMTGSGLGDTVLVQAGNAEATYTDKGGTNLITFVDGNNTYIGDKAAGNTAFDTVVAGSGYDTIITGANHTTVASGAGHATIALNDTGTTPGSGDSATLDNGTNVVYANGQYDSVFATVAGQTIFGGAAAGDLTSVTLGVDVAKETSPTAAAGDSVISGAGALNVFVYNSANTIYGGTGTLSFIATPGAAGTTLDNTVVGSTGTTNVFGASGNDISFFDSVTSGSFLFVAGSGNETLNGAGGISPMTLYGGVDSASPSSVHDSLVGGTANDTFVTGTGSETLVGGLGNNTFFIDNTGKGPANITISDFGSSAGNVVGFIGYTQSDYQNAIAHETVTSGTMGNVSTSITLSDGTTVTFAGVNGLSGHVI